MSNELESSLQIMILKTRFQIPPLRSVRVQRNRLIRKLDGILKSRLTLIVAPAGFGKTTLICEWITNSKDDVAWLSLDGLELNDHEFLSYVVHAFQTVKKQVGDSALALLQASAQVDLESVFTKFINELIDIPTPIVLVLDDYHALSQHTEIDQALLFFIHNMPQHIHIVMTSRTLPNINLSRLRAQAQLLEITSAELRFTDMEVEQFLAEVIGVNLTDTQRLKLESKTGGWITGLQLAGNTLKQAQHIDDFIQAFSGQEYSVRQYLLEEIFQKQSPQIQQFLIATSFLDELCTDLCDALLEIEDSQQILEQLESYQLFITPIDYQHHWYRYHSIFKEFLQPLLNREPDDKLKHYFHRASRWYEANHNIYSAIRFTLQTQDYERIATLLETYLSEHDWVHRDMYRLDSWFKSLPQAVIENHISLYLNYAWLKLEVYENVWDEIRTDVERIRTLLVGDHTRYSAEELTLFSAQADMLMVNYARFCDDHLQVIELCQVILDKLPDDEQYIRGGAIAHMASAYESLEDYQQAQDQYERAIQICRMGNNVDGLLFASWKLLELLLDLDELPHAKTVYEELEAYHETRTGPDMGAIYIAIGEVYRRMNNITRARTFLEKGIELCEPFPAWRESTSLGQQRLKQLEQVAESIDALTERELETLMFLQSDLSIAEIADKLSVSISTVRTYCKRIYNKLGVHSRAEAVFRARDFNLL